MATSWGVPMIDLRTAALVLGIAGLTPLVTTCHYGVDRTVAPERPTVEGNAQPTGLRGFHYTVAVDPALAWADVQICFDGPPPARLVPGIPQTIDHVSDVRGPAGEPLPAQGRGYPLGALGEDACASYRVDFAGLEADEDTDRVVGRTGDSLLARPSAWLWRPDPRPADADVTLRFSLPEGMRVSVPWPTRPEPSHGSDRTTYVLDDTAFEWLSYAVFGDIALDRFEHAGARIELVTLDAPVACPPAGLRDWVTDAVDTVALLFDGRFPREQLQLVVIPVEGGGGGTVYFGMAARGGGAGVQIFLDDQARAEALPGGWTTVHELLHHGMPFIEEAWMAEGWVTYYTELMRTRAGHRSERDGWSAVLDGFGRGRRTEVDATLAGASETMHETHAYQRVYWGGAAIALFADIEIRLETGGTRSLDDAMKELRRCCGDAAHLWKAEALLARLDAWYGRPLFTRTAQAVLDQRGFPDVEAALARLGVHAGIDGTVVLDDEHPAAAHRRAIMAPLR
jgi:hypothetical protein